MFRDLSIPRLLIAGFVTAGVAWVLYKLLLFITGATLPFTTLKAEVVTFLPIFITFTLAFLVIIMFGKYFKIDERIKPELISVLGAQEVQIRTDFLAKLATEENEEAIKGREQYISDIARERASIISEDMQRRDGTLVADWREVLLVARKRLVEEEYRLLANNKINLDGAMSMAFIGVVLPIYYIFFLNEVGEESNLWTIFASYWPIFSVAVVFEIIAAFFLRVYAQTARSIERNKNEITNVELRLAAGLMMSKKTAATKFDSLADTLSKEERNFVLGKNESSTGVSSSKLLELISSLLSKGTP